MPTNPRSLEITERYRSGMVGLRRRGKAEAKRIWQRVEPADLDGTFDIGAMVMTVSTLQREAARLSSGYLASFVSSEIGEPQSPPPVWVYNRTFNDKPLHQGLRSATIVAKIKIGDGMDPVEATKAARSVLLIDVGLYIDTAARESLRQGMEDHPQIEGYRRAIRGTCAACMGAAEGSMLPPGTPLEIHPDCQCVSEPVIAPTAPGEQMRTIPQAAQRVPGAGEAFSAYRSTGYDSINGYLRGTLDPDILPSSQVAQIEEWITKMDATFASVEPASAPVRLFRGLNGRLEDLFPQLGKAAQGQVIDEAGFSSATASRQVAESFGPTQFGGDLLEMTVHPNTRGMLYSGAKDAEVLLQRDVSYVINGIREEGGKRIIEVVVKR